MKFKILMLITLIAVGCVGYYAFLASKKEPNLQSPISEKTEIANPPATKISDKTVEYSDPAGFKFAYPADLKLQTIDKKDASYYASLKISSKNPDENITVDITSTKYLSLADWEKNNMQITRNSKDLKIAELAAKEISTAGKIITIAVDTDTLITVTTSFSNQNARDWKKANDTIISTFAFEVPETTNPSNKSEDFSEEDVVFEGEEVIE